MATAKENNKQTIKVTRDKRTKEDKSNTPMLNKNGNFTAFSSVVKPIVLIVQISLKNSPSSAESP